MTPLILSPAPDSVSAEPDAGAGHLEHHLYRAVCRKREIVVAVAENRLPARSLRQDREYGRNPNTWAGSHLAPVKTRLGSRQTVPELTACGCRLNAAHPDGAQTMMRAGCGAADLAEQARCRKARGYGVSHCRCSPGDRVKPGGEFPGNGGRGQSNFGSGGRIHRFLIGRAENPLVD